MRENTHNWETTNNNTHTQTDTNRNTTQRKQTTRKYRRNQQHQQQTEANKTGLRANASTDILPRLTSCLGCQPSIPSGFCKCSLPLFPRVFFVSCPVFYVFYVSIFIGFRLFLLHHPCSSLFLLCLLFCCVCFLSLFLTGCARSHSSHVYALRKIK